MSYLCACYSPARPAACPPDVTCCTLEPTAVFLARPHVLLQDVDGMALAKPKGTKRVRREAAADASAEKKQRGGGSGAAAAAAAAGDSD